MSADPDNFLRFGSFRETEVLKAVKSQVRGLTFNANVIAHTPAAISKFLFISFPDTQYFIDPQTYIFQLDPLKFYCTQKIEGDRKETVLKSSVEELVSWYKEPTTELKTKLKALSVVDFKDINSFCENVLSFQKTAIVKGWPAEDFEGYESEDVKERAPSFYIPPYFLLSHAVGNVDAWLDLSIKAIEHARSLQEYRSNLAAEIVLDQQVLFDDQLREKIVQKYLSSGVNTFLIWVDDLDESDASVEYLEKVKEFYTAFQGKRVINLYGGAFSLLLQKKGLLGGFCHGPGYGESRGTRPVGGGIPVAKFYLRDCCQRIDFELAFQIIKTRGFFENEQKFFSSVCDCAKCKESITGVSPEDGFSKYGQYKLSKKGREIPETETLINSQIHYLHCRFSELEQPVDVLEKRIKDFLIWHETSPIISTQHLTNWLQVLHNGQA